MGVGSVPGDVSLVEEWADDIGAVGGDGVAGGGEGAFQLVRGVDGVEVDGESAPLEVGDGLGGRVPGPEAELVDERLGGLSEGGGDVAVGEALEEERGLVPAQELKLSVVEGEDEAAVEDAVAAAGVEGQTGAAVVVLLELDEGEGVVGAGAVDDVERLVEGGDGGVGEFGAFQAPKSRARSSSRVRSWTEPWPLEQRSRSWSWVMTRCPSRVGWTSNSRVASPNSSAFRKETRVFSG